MPHHPTTVVIGAGFSGTLLSLFLQDLAPAGTRIRLIEGASCFAVGPAYATANPNHLLNAPAGRMSAFPDLPMDFVHWLQRQPRSHLTGPVPREDSFVSRTLYGLYLQHLLERGLRSRCSRSLELVDDRVTSIEELPDRVTLLMASGAVVSADLAVLAVGLPGSAACHPEIAVLEAAGLWRRDPWAPAAYAALDPAAPVLLVGCGLTMVDTVISLLDLGHSGPIHAISRRGLLPRRHAVPPTAPIVLPPLPEGLLPLFRCIRGEAARAVAAGLDWRAVIDALRPITPDLWRALREGEQRQFLRHVRAWWDAHRHRMPPRVADRIEAAQAAGQLQLRAGRIVGMAVDDGQASVTFRTRPTGDLQTLTAARVIDCTGPGRDISGNSTPLLRKLFGAGLARPDPLRLGLDVTEDGALVNSAGVASQRLFAVGPLTRGSAWEITAVPELRRQCRDMAHALSRRLMRLGVGDDQSADDVAPWSLFAGNRECLIGQSGVN
jgi:uncharacterized NAD(P)/FAD-binding protein YdhS